MTLLTKEQAALLASCSIATVDRGIAQGKIEAKRLGNRVLLDPADVDRWIASRVLPIATSRQIFAAR